MRFRAFAWGWVFVLPLMADDQVKRLLTRLAEEASAFEQLAPNVLAEETLRQRAMKPKSRRIGPRIVRPGEAAKPPEYQTRDIVSEYGYSTIGSGRSIREFRRVVSVDGKKVESNEKAIAALAKGIQSQDERVKRKLLEDFEKHGLIGTVTDFGPLLLLFDRRNSERYEIRPAGSRLIGADQCLAFSYTQLDGPETLTIWDGKNTVRQRIAGQIIVRAEDFVPVQISLVSLRGVGAATIREEAQVNYLMTQHGAVMPVSVSHREFRAEGITAENLFTYGPFRRFGASSGVKFEADPDPAKKP